MKQLKTTLIIACLLMSVTAQARISLPSLIGDNMILQQQSEVRLWGTTSHKGGKVKITPSWSPTAIVCTADAEGRWTATAMTPKGSFRSHSIVFDDGEITSVQNVLVGEVWLAAGQSNMEMPLRGFWNCPVETATDAILNAGAQKGIRFFTVPKAQSYEPKTECGGSWKLSNATNAPDFSAVAYYFAETLTRVIDDVPVGIVVCAFGGSRIESWTNRQLLEQYPDINLSQKAIEETREWMRPMVMYNAMFRPIANYAYKGIIWYQGESNIGKHKDFVSRLSNMVDLWRKELGNSELPFLTVEIAPFKDYGGSGPYLREAQNKAAATIANTAIVSTNDLVKDYEQSQIHPCRKQEVGQRLGLVALNKAYHLVTIPCEGPTYKGMSVNGNTAVVSFNNAKDGFNRDKHIAGFEIAGADRVFYPADTVIVNPNSHEIYVTSKRVMTPVAVRYCFRDFLCGNLAGNYGLPVVPFRTDNW